MQNLHDDSIDILAIETAARIKDDREVIEKKIELIKQIRERERFNKIELYETFHNFLATIDDGQLPHH